MQDHEYAPRPISLFPWRGTARLRRVFCVEESATAQQNLKIFVVKEYVPFVLVKAIC